MNKHGRTQNEQCVGQLYFTTLFTRQPLHDVPTQFIQRTRGDDFRNTEVFQEGLGTKSELFPHRFIHPGW